MKKRLYVSPFFKVKGYYNINFCINKNSTKLSVIYKCDEKILFEACFNGCSIKFTGRNIIKVFFSRLLQNVKVTLAIYYEALKLFLKGANVNAETDSGATPLDVANTWDHRPAADLLRKHGGKTAEELKAAGN